MKYNSRRLDVNFLLTQNKNFIFNCMERLTTSIVLIFKLTFLRSRRWLRSVYNLNREIDEPTLKLSLFSIEMPNFMNNFHCFILKIQSTFTLVELRDMFNFILNEFCLRCVIFPFFFANLLSMDENKTKISLNLSFVFVFCVENE